MTKRSKVTVENGIATEARILFSNGSLDAYAGFGQIAKSVTPWDTRPHERWIKRFLKVGWRITAKYYRRKKWVSVTVDLGYIDLPIDFLSANQAEIRFYETMRHLMTQLEGSPSELRVTKIELIGRREARKNEKGREKIKRSKGKMRTRKKIVRKAYSYTRKGKKIRVKAKTITQRFVRGYVNKKGKKVKGYWRSV